MKGVPQHAKNILDMIDALAKGLFSNFDEKEYSTESRYEFYIVGLVREARRLGLSEIASNAVCGIFDHDYVLKKEKNYEETRKNGKNSNKWFIQSKGKRRRTSVHVSIEHKLNHLNH